MKQNGRFLLSIFAILYFIIVVIFVVFMLGHNKYGVTEVFGYTIFNVENKQLKPFKEGNLLFVKTIHPRDVQEGDEIFFYEVINNNADIKIKKVNSVYSVDDDKKLFMYDNNKSISSQYLIGKVEFSRVYSSIGSIYAFLQTKLGFVIIIILPILIIFIYKMSKIVFEAQKISEKRTYNNENSKYASAENDDYVIKKQKPLRIQEQEKNVNTLDKEVTVSVVTPIEIKTKEK